MLENNIIEFIRSNFEDFSVYDSGLYNELCKMIRESLGLEYYLHRIDNERICKTPNVILYDETGVIKLDAKRIYDSAKELVISGQFRENNEDVRVIVMLKNIFQMIRYIVDFKNIDEGKVDFEESFILHGIMARLGNFNLDIQDKSKIDVDTANKIFYANGDLYPNERRAKIQAISLVSDIYRGYEFQDFDVLSDLLIWLSETRISGYGYNRGVLECPLYKFYRLIGKPLMFLERYFYDYDVKERIELGMPASAKELMMDIIETLELNPKDERVRSLAKSLIK